MPYGICGSDDKSSGVVIENRRGPGVATFRRQCGPSDIAEEVHNLNGLGDGIPAGIGGVRDLLCTGVIGKLFFTDRMQAGVTLERHFCYGVCYGGRCATGQWD